MTGSPDRPLVSVIMNCLNGEAYLREALDSVAAQTWDSWEVIFWDNGSTDASAAIARSYGEAVRYFRSTQTVPLGAARNLAMREAKGEYIAFLDVDDVWLPGTLATLVDEMERGQWAVCYAGVYHMDAQGRTLATHVPPLRRGNLLDALLQQFDIWVPSVMLRRSALESSGLAFDSRIVASEEYCLFVQLAATLPFCSLPVPLARYRVHDNALTNKSIDKWAEEREYTLQRVKEAHPGIERQHRRAFREAHARARYYRARWYMSRGDKLPALRQLSHTVFVHGRYTALFLLALLPVSAWDAVHRARSHRSAYGT